MRFIDIIIGQVLTARTRLGVDLPLTLMNSFRTSKDTMKVLQTNKKFHQEDIPMEIIQHQEPKISVETGMPGQSGTRMVPAGPRRPVLHHLGIRSA